MQRTTSVMSLIGTLVLACSSQHASAQYGGGGYTPPPQTIYEVDWNERLAPNVGLKAHRDDLLGDIIDIHTGRLSFEQVDVSIPGNSDLAVEIRRRRNSSQSENNAFEDWQLAVPTISTKIFSLEFFGGQRWGKHRCTDPLVSSIPDSYAAQAYLNHLALPVPPVKYSDGVILDVPGRVTDSVLDKTVSSAWPSQAKKVTVSGWYLTCISNIDGAGTEGFYAYAPNGDRYRFDVIRSRTRVAYNDLWYIQYYVGGSTSLFASEGVNYDILAASEVTDVNGNWVRYEYDGQGRLTQIHSNDGRQIDIAYDVDNRISSVSANTGTADERQWTYDYGWRSVTLYRAPTTANGVPSTYSWPYPVLETVTLPDGRSWQFDLGGLFAKPVPGDHYNTIPGGTYVDCKQLDQVATVVHPDGIVGEFQLEELRRFLPDAAASQYGPPCPNSSIGFGANTIADVMAVVRKTLSGPNVPTAVWDYDYYDAGSLTPNGQNGPNRTIITRPDGTYQYNHYVPGGSYIRIVREEDFTNVTDTVPVQSIDYDYFQESPAGYDFLHGYYKETASPVRTQEVTITRGNDTYNTNYSYVTDRTSANYSYGFPTHVDEWSSLGAGTRTTDVTYLVDQDDWILGLTHTITKNGKPFDDYAYDTKGRLTSHNRFGVTVATLTYHTSGDEAGKLYTYNDALGRQTTFTDYFRGIPQTITRADNTTHTRVIDSNGWVKEDTNPRGYTTKYQYNPAGWLTKIDRPSAWTDTTIGYSYSNGNLIQTATQGSKQTTTTYDDMLRPILERQQALSSGGGSIYVGTTYDGMGRKVFRSLPATSANYTIGISTSYDEIGRVTQTQETASGGGITSYTYLSGNRTQVTDPSGFVTTTTADGYASPDDGNTVKVEKPLGITVDYTYDIYGNVLTISQAKGGGVTHDSSFVYDNRNRLCRRKVPETGDKLYAYNDADELTSYAEGQPSNSTCPMPPSASRVTLQYDLLGRLTTTDYPSGTPDIARTYDANGNLKTSNRGGVNWTYTYNSLDLISSETLTLDSRTYAIGYTYNNNGYLTARSFPSGTNYIFTNDGFGRPKKIQGNGTYYASHGSYHPNGKVHLLTRGNGDVYEQQLNARQLTSLIGSTYGDDLNYTYDVNGRVTQIDAVANNAFDRTLTYDGSGRLKTASGPWGSGSYYYDPLNNITSKRLGPREVDIEYDSLNRVYRVKDSGVSRHWRYYSHDARGNVTADGNHNFTYDFANQPVTVSGADSGSYSYDGNLKRVKQVVGGETIYSVYDLSGGLVTRDNVTSGNTTDYLSVAGQTFARITNGVAAYPLNDHLGTAFMVEDQNGNIPANQTYNYTPFGEAYGSYSPGSNNEQGFTGHVEDETGLTYMQARYYDPIMGRFLQTDPVGYKDQLNMYAYVSNNPVNRMDPNGLYGRGQNWTDKEWNRFDKAQQRAARLMTKRADRMERKADKLDAKGKEGGDSLRAMANTLRAGTIALTSDEFVADAVTESEFVAAGGSAGAAAGVPRSDRSKMLVVIDSDGWKGKTEASRSWITAHESMHSTPVQLDDRGGSNGATAYKYGSPAERKAFESLRGTIMELLNPDNVIDHAL